jgi:hypothetical protein
VTNDTKRRQLVDHIYKGTRKAGLLNLYNGSGGRFTIEQLLSKAKGARDAGAQSDIYLAGSKNFKQGSPFRGKKPMTYIGETGNFVQRMDDHDYASTKARTVTSHHYAARQDAQQRKDVVLCLVPKDHQIK